MQVPWHNIYIVISVGMHYSYYGMDHEKNDDLEPAVILYSVHKVLHMSSKDKEEGDNRISNNQ